MIAAATIAKILDTSRVEEVIGDFVALKKRGVNYIGNCPFHTEKTPSFTVSPAKGIYKCFGCGKSGNVTKFVMDHEHLSYVESLAWLGKKYNIEIENIELTTEQKLANKQREDLFNLNKLAQEYFTDILLNDEEGRAIGLSYFKERNYREETIRKFNLGYCLDKEKSFTDYAISKGYTLEILKQVGLTQQQRNGDFFRGRVIFPIQNVNGKIIAFGGRVLKTNLQTAKYFNSPESEIYQKRQSLYGIFQAKNAILKETFCYLVEGYTDVISLSQGGIENVVSSSGTALTIEQIRILKRFTPNILLIYDGDAAGIKAAFRGLELMIEEGINLKVVLLPKDEDPDSFIQKQGKGGFSEYVTKEAKDFVKFMIQFSLEESKIDPHKKAIAAREIMAVLAKIPDPIIRVEYIKEFSKLMDIQEPLVNVEVNKLLRDNLNKENNSYNTTKQNEEDFLKARELENQLSLSAANNTFEQEKNIIRILVEWAERKLTDNHTVSEILAEEIDISLMEETNFAHFFMYFLESVQKGEKITTNFFKNSSDPQIAEMAADALSFPYSVSPNWLEKHKIIVKDREENYQMDVKSVIHHFKIKKIIKLLDDNLKKIKTCNSDEELIQLQHIHSQFNKIKTALALASGTVITH